MSIFFPNMYFFKGAIQSLETLRMGQCGTLMLGMFISIDIAPARVTAERIIQLDILANITLLILAQIPTLFNFLYLPYYDFYISVM